MKKMNITINGYLFPIEVGKLTSDIIKELKLRTPLIAGEPLDDIDCRKIMIRVTSLTSAEVELLCPTEQSRILDAIVDMMITEESYVN